MEEARQYPAVEAKTGKPSGKTAVSQVYNVTYPQTAGGSGGLVEEVLIYIYDISQVRSIIIYSHDNISLYYTRYIWVRIFAWYGHLRWGFRTPKWEHKSGARNYFPFEIEKTKRNKICMLHVLLTYNRIRSQKFRFRSGSSFAPHFCAPIWVSETPT